MDKDSNLKPCNGYKLFYMYAMLIYLGGATIMTRYTMSTLSSKLGCIIGILLTVILAVKHYTTKHNNSKILNIVGVFSLWIFAQCLKFSSIQIPYSYLYVLVTAYILCNVYDDELFVYFEHCMVQLCKISIVLWITCWLFPPLRDLLISITPHNWICGLTESNILIFGLHDPAYSSGFGMFFRRNCGFAWEPGRFSSIIAITLLINLMLNKFKIKGNRNLYVLIGALLTTQSTTGFGVAMLIIFCYIYNMQRKYFIPALSVGILFSLIILSLPFMGDKLRELWLTDDHINEFANKVEWMADNTEGGYVPQRFDALMYESMNIATDPLLGYGKDISKSFIGTTFNNGLILYNGVLKIFAIFGLIWGFLYYYLILRGSIYISRKTNTKGVIWFMLIFIAINVSYPFFQEPLFVAMIIMPFVYYSKDSLKTIQ